jgi:NAD(P)H-flavin reductase
MRSLHFTIRRVGAVSDALCQLRPGSQLGLRGPFGQAWPLHAATQDELLVIAGGVGLAPLRPVIEMALRHRSRWEKVHVLHGARDPDHILYADCFESWREAGLEILVTVDSAPASWNGPVGVVTKLMDQMRWNPGKTLALLCGPEIMMRFSADLLLQAGMSPRNIHLSMERNMKCALGWCGHCQYGSYFVCKDAPVFRYDRIAAQLRVKEL